MGRAARRRAAVWAAIACAAALAGCSGGGAEADAAPVQSARTVTVSGAVTFDRVPTSAAGLDFAAAVAAPARGVTVRAVRNGTVLAQTATNETGEYALALPVGETGVRIEVRAEMLETASPAWDFRVVDNTQGDGLFVLESSPLSVGEAGVALDLHAPSGWDGTAYTAPRAAAPFAILDVVYDAAALVRSADPQRSMPPLRLHWSPQNVPTTGADGRPDYAAGQIGNTFFLPAAQASGTHHIYLLGAAGSDTDEFDRHVIAHEWAHFLEHALGRSDSIGGPHTRFDQLDMRAAFSEGFANAFAAMVTGETVYTDVLSPGVGDVFRFDIEGPYTPQQPNLAPGWFSEESVQEIVWDLFDGATDGADTLGLGFAPIFAVLTEELRSGVPLTSLFSFIDALRTRDPAFAPQIDALLAEHSIGPFTDAYGTGEQNAGLPLDAANWAVSDVLPVYTQATIGVPVTVCSTTAYHRAGELGGINKLGSRAFIRFTTPASGVYRFTAAATELPPGADGADPDMRLHAGGLLYESFETSDEAMCHQANPGGCMETFERMLGVGDFVLEVYEWTNTQRQGAIGRTCFDVQVAAQ